MAAESLGLAASVAGIVSLGLQLTAGIVKYVDAFENRDEELESVKQQSEALETTLRGVKSQLSSHGQSGVVRDAVVQSMQLFEKELNHVKTLHSELVDTDPQSWTTRLNNKKKRLTYAFDRSRIQELGLRLQKAGDALQLTLNVLGLQVLIQNKDTLAAVGSSSQSISSEVSLVRSGLAAIKTPIVKINNQLCLLQGGVESNTQLLVSQYEALSFQVQGSSNDVLRTVHHFSQVQSRHEQEMARMNQNIGQILERLQQTSIQIPVSEAVIRGLVGKPALLKEIHDEVQPSEKTEDQMAKADLCVRPVQKMVASPVRQYPSPPMLGRVCTCPRLQSAKNSKWIQLGHACFSSEWETIGHWPSCPRAKMTNKKRVTMGLRYNGLARILKAAINVSFAMTSGAGGFSISPSFTYSPTVDDNFDPAFRIVSLIGEGLYALDDKNPESFMMACMTRLGRLLDDRKVYATAVDRQNMSLMHHAISALDTFQPNYYGEQGRGIMRSLFVELVQMLLSYGVPAFAFDSKGMSPLVNLRAWLFEYEIAQAVIDVLIQANSEKQPLALDTSYIQSEYEDTEFSIPTISVKSQYEVSSGFAEGCECGPLSMAVIQGDANGVKHMLDRTPSLIAETDIFGQTPFHLAAANPSILEILLRYGDSSILDRRDMSGFTALEAAMLHTSDYCDNGRDTQRCDGNECGCCQCVDLLLDVECDVRMHKLEEGDRQPELNVFLIPASELARRKYVYYMKRQRHPATRSPSSSPHTSTKSVNSESSTEYEIKQVGRNTTGSPQQRGFSSLPDTADDMGWVFLEIDDPYLGELFYRHGFQPRPSCLNQLSWSISDTRGTMNCTYLDWLVSHGVDPSFRSSKGPILTKDSPNTGLFGAHFAFYFISLSLEAIPSSGVSTLDTGSWDTYMALNSTICRQNLTDGCKCHCTIDGCSPFTWMMKGSYLLSSPWVGTVQIKDRDVNKLVSHYSRCGVELTSLTYKAAIRYATFGALGLAHTCCDAWRFACYEREWVLREDVDILNEEQAPLLERLEDLVQEFEEKAVEFTKTDSSGNSLFPDFWVVCWKVRMEEELEKLEGKELTEEERRGAEEIGVRWTVSQQEANKGNPYNKRDPGYWFYELDEICPEYAEPWPEESRRVTDLP